MAQLVDDGDRQWLEALLPYHSSTQTLCRAVWLLGAPLNASALRAGGITYITIMRDTLLHTGGWWKLIRPGCLAVAATQLCWWW